MDTPRLIEIHIKVYLHTLCVKYQTQYGINDMLTVQDDKVKANNRVNLVHQFIEQFCYADVDIFNALVIPQVRCVFTRHEIATILTSHDYVAMCCRQYLDLNQTDPNYVTRLNEIVDEIYVTLVHIVDYILLCLRSHIASNTLGDDNLTGNEGDSNDDIDELLQWSMYTMYQLYRNMNVYNLAKLCGYTGYEELHNSTIDTNDVDTLSMLLSNIDVSSKPTVTFHPSTNFNWTDDSEI